MIACCVFCRYFWVTTCTCAFHFIRLKTDFPAAKKSFNSSMFPRSRLPSTLREASNAKKVEQKKKRKLKNANCVQNSHYFILHFLSHIHQSHSLIPHFSGILDHSQSFIPHFLNFRLHFFYNVFSFVSKKFDTPSVKLR